MNLYHGTSITSINNNIEKDGLKPRGETSGVWFPLSQSHPNFVYLTKNPDRIDFYSFRSALANNDFTCARITVDSDSLDEQYFRPDEHYYNNKPDGDCNLDDVKQWQYLAEHDGDLWKQSLEKHGAVGYLKKIPVDKISIETYPIEENTYFEPEFLKIDDLNLKLSMHSWYVNGLNMATSYYNTYKRILSKEYVNYHTLDENIRKFIDLGVDKSNKLIGKV